MDSDTVAEVELNRSRLTVYGVSTEGEYCVTSPRLERRIYDYTRRGRCGLMKGKSEDRPILTIRLQQQTLTLSSCDMLLVTPSSCACVYYFLSRHLFCSVQALLLRTMSNSGT